MIDEFKEIAHGGGKVTFNINYASGGEVKFNIRYSTSRPVPIRITGIYALPDGRPVANWDLGGLGQPDYTHRPPPISNCYPFLLSQIVKATLGIIALNVTGIGVAALLRIVVPIAVSSLIPTNFYQKHNVSSFLIIVKCFQTH